jgi:hypothetical protein
MDLTTSLKSKHIFTRTFSIYSHFLLLYSHLLLLYSHLLLLYSHFLLLYSHFLLLHSHFLLLNSHFLLLHSHLLLLHYFFSIFYSCLLFEDEAHVAAVIFIDSRLSPPDTAKLNVLTCDVVFGITLESSGFVKWSFNT